MLEHDSVPFCYYDISQRKDGGLIPLDFLRSAVDLAIRNSLTINFLYGPTDLPSEYEEVIEEAEHMKIMPLRRKRPDDNALAVLDGTEDLRYLDVLGKGDPNNIILRIARDALGSLIDLAQALAGRCKRINIILKDAGRFTEEDLSVYEACLENLRLLLQEEYRKGNFLEINVLSDRVFLTNMNNCDAGVRHLTVAPNGRLYLCPAFYHENEDRSLCGIGESMETGNGRLLELGYAPVCRNCDAWHCKRCLYLNEKLTSEVNTPSRQQCVLAHLEREASRKFLAAVGDETGLSARVAPIVKLDYLDPFDIISDRNVSAGERDEHFAYLLAKPLERVPVKELLRQIYRTDPGMLVRLKEQNARAVDLEEKE